MSGELDEKAVMCGGCGAIDPQQRCIGCLHEFYPNRLAASPSPSMEMGVVATSWVYMGKVRYAHDVAFSPSDIDRGIVSEVTPLVTLSSARSALAAMRAERDRLDEECRLSMGAIASERNRAEAAEAQVQRLTEEKEALRKERTSLIETKREQIERMQRRLDMNEAAISFVRRWAVEKDGNGTSAEERLSAIAHHPALKENAL